MSNTLLTISMVTREILRVLENNLTFAKGVNREYDSAYAIKGAKIGDTLNVRKPSRYVGRTGRTLTVEDHKETSVPVVLTTQFGVDVNFTSADLLLKMDDFSRRFAVPAAAAIANKIDLDGLALYKDVANAVGTPGTTPSALLTYLQAAGKLDKEACPRDGQRAMVIAPNEQVTIVDALKGLFHSSSEIERQYEQGNMGLVGGMKWSMDQNVNAHTVGTYGGTPLTNGAGVAGASTLVTDGWTPTTTVLKKGDIFTIAGVFAVNPQNRQSTGDLRQFTVTADTVTDGAGNSTISISPPLNGPEAATIQYQNITALPADNAAITVMGASGVTSRENMAYHRDAFTLVSADLPLPGGVDMASRVSDSQLGISIRMIRQYDINTDEWPCRLDVLYGWKTLYQELACRVRG